MSEEEMLAYLDALPEEVRKVMMDAIFNSVGHWAVKGHRRYLRGGLEN